MVPVSQKIVNTNPLVLSGILTVLGIVLVIILCQIPDSTVEWKVLTSCILLYCTTSPLFSIFKKKWGQYILLSIIGFCFLLGVLLVFTNYVSNASLNQLRGVKMSLAALSVFYVILIGLTAVYRFFVAYLKEVGNKP